MAVLIFILCYFYIFIPAAVGVILTIVKKTKQANKTENYNRMMNRFIYKVPMTSEELLSALRLNNVREKVYCTIDTEKAEMTFSNPVDPREYRKYRYCIQEEGEYSILRIEEICIPMGTRGYLHMKINPFVLKKLNAEKMVYYQHVDSWDRAFGRGE